MTRTRGPGQQRVDHVKISRAPGPAVPARKSSDSLQLRIRSSVGGQNISDSSKCRGACVKRLSHRAMSLGVVYSSRLSANSDGPLENDPPWLFDSPPFRSQIPFPRCRHESGRPIRPIVAARDLVWRSSKRSCPPMAEPSAFPAPWARAAIFTSISRPLLTPRGARHFPLGPCAFFRDRRRDAFHRARDISGNHTVLRSLAARNGRDQWYRVNPGRSRNLFWPHALRCRMGTDRFPCRRLPGQRSCGLDRYGHCRTYSTRLDALGTTTLPAVAHHVGLLGLPEPKESSVRLP